ncbi:Phenylacetic acid catabolic protein [Roseicyclus sp. F158]|uniref:Phenylacetic acid catabolic protein n=1 Tax=Tropicimonas omnivorans TaxID=3075590 RepID=A0ABU3DGC1_9RHOB|nr:Phenylacetic acid catabolic protein [Roseicyclus sp. F158]MDT0682197.1 Phenylacetic acid catabolic protein [Roseicyclus sp. F158]
MTNEFEPAGETAPLGDYLARGGKLTSPDNVPPRYRGELLRMMSSFVDSELAGSAGFAGAINWAPGIKERIAASRIVLEKADHAERVLDVMEEFGTDKSRYNSVHDWAARTDRETRLDPERQGLDMRLSVFNYPLESWTDAVVMNVLMGLATMQHLSEMERASYAPFAEQIRNIAPRERRHMELGLEGLERIASEDAGREAARASVAYWHPRVEETFGPDASDRYERLRQMGLRHRSGGELRRAWRDEAQSRLTALGLDI